MRPTQTEEVVFHPKIRPQFRRAIAISFLFVVLGITLILVFPEEFVLGLLIAIPTGISGLYVAMALPHEIRFGCGMTIRYRFRQDRHIPYDEIIDFGVGRLVFKTGTLALGTFSNVEEFGDLLDMLVEDGVIAEDQLSGMAWERDALKYRALYLTGSVTIVTGGLILAGIIPMAWVTGSVLEIVATGMFFAALYFLIYAGMLIWKNKTAA